MDAAAGLDGKDEPSSVSVSGQASSSSSSSSFSSSGSLKPFSRDGMSPTEAAATWGLPAMSICTDGDETVVAVALPPCCPSSVRGFLDEDEDSAIDSLAGEGDVEEERVSPLFKLEESLERRRSMSLRRQLLLLLFDFFVGDGKERAVCWLSSCCIICRSLVPLLPFKTTVMPLGEIRASAPGDKGSGSR